MSNKTTTTTRDDWDVLSPGSQSLLGILSKAVEMTVESFEGFGFTLRDVLPLEDRGFVRSLGVHGWMVTRQGKYVAEDNKNRKAH